jgi:cystathionine gamma-synthase
MTEPEAGFSTRAIHVGSEPDELTGAVIPPIHLSTTFRQPHVGELPAGYDYSRSGNPTRSALQHCLASLEGVDAAGEPIPGVTGLSFASGLAATDVVLRTLLKPGDHLVMPDDAYGGTFRLVDKVVQAWGVDYSVAPLAQPESARTAVIAGRTKVIWVETPSNPMLSVVDIAAYARTAREVGATLVVDNTFATPYLQNPLALGADVVVHSATKYLGGHSDVVGGAVITADGALADAMAFLQNAAGAVPSPFDCWLTLRGIKTLAVRMERHCDNAQAVVDALIAHPAVSRVYFPGLADNVGHAVAAQQMRRFGAMVSFQVHGGAEAARTVAESTKIFTLGESLGGVESLIEVPAAMTHMSAAGSQLEVPADLVRLSVGIEDAADLVADIQRALDRV